MREKLLIICGPTASGKSSLAIECAKILDTEIISADSMNVYKNLDIGTAKPTATEKQGIKHHLIDVVEPTNNFSVGDYRDFALPIVNNLLNKGKVPIICGGTGFYINSILYNYSYGNVQADLKIREKYNLLAKERGNEFVFEILKQKDYESAKKLHPNDLKRVIRALEIAENGIKKSELNDSMKPNYDYNAYMIDYDSKILYEKINSRVDTMVKQGLFEEVTSLYNLGITSDYQCMQGIGYKEVIEFIKGNLSREQTIDLIKLNTRHYAKRQRTFFKKLNNLIYLHPDDVHELAKRITNNYER